MKIRHWSPAEKKLLDNTAEEFLLSPITDEIVIIVLEEINKINEDEGQPLRNKRSVGVELYRLRKRLRTKKLHEHEEITKPPVVEKVSPIETCESVSVLLKKLNQAICGLTSENTSLKKEITELKAQLRKLRDIRQAVENYQRSG